MSKNKKRRKNQQQPQAPELPMAGASGAGKPRKPRNYSRWRALTLSTVYLLFGLHMAHWYIKGTSLAPLELNEVMYTLELGIITAGFLFMGVALVSVLVFGRFFCSWGCHILALEDLSAWLLMKVGIRPKAMRSRVLLLVPPLALFYMFVWPQILRIYKGEPLPQLYVATDAQGWASFVTTDFFRNLPGIWITVLTFLISGFVIVYFLGTRSFCRYACPYGALFALADRVAPGRIVSKGGCEMCGQCTAACQSNIRVHEELKQYGKIVSPDCLKDLDCVAVCPNDAIGFGYRKPSLFKSWSRSVRRHYDFSLGEEVVLAVTWLATLFVFRGLYARVPFLVTLGLGGIMGYVAVLTIRLLRRESVAFNKFRLKRSGRLNTAGSYFLAGSCVLLLFVGHSAFVRFHEFKGHGAYDKITSVGSAQPLPDDPALLAGATAHLEQVERWGLFNPPELDQRLATLHLLGDSPELADPYLERIVEREPAAAHELKADIWATRGDHAMATSAYRMALAEDPGRLKSHLSLAELLANTGNYAEAVEHLEAAVAIKNDSAKTRYNLAVLLGQLGREDDAIGQYEVAARLTPHDVEIQNNLGFMLASKGELEAAEERFRTAIELNPGYAHSHFNLGRLLLMKGRNDEAETEFSRAAELDPAYAEVLR